VSIGSSTASPSDPDFLRADFLRAVAESEKEGKLTVGTESVLLAPTDYSPAR